ncbi:MAG: pilus assembly protein TadG-related protein [Chloroflexota bacterium]
MIKHTARARERERGQILVLFTLSLVAIIAMVGLVIDGGSAFAQRRFEQNAADLAAVAGANAYMNASGSVAAKSAAAVAAAHDAADRNGYVHGTDGAALNVNVALLSSGATVQVGLTKPHANTFARVVGQNTWDVSVTASAIAGSIDTAVGAAPWMMHIDAFNGDGTPKYGTPGTAQAFGEPPGNNTDYPQGQFDIAWTDFNGGNNVNAAEVKRIIDGTNIVTATMDFDQYVGQHNSGMQTTIFDDVDSELAGKTLPVPVVGPCPADPSNHGCFKGWVLFTIVSASGGSNKTITGYMADDFVSQPLSVGQCTTAQQAAGTCGVIGNSPFDAFVVRLSD